MATPTEELIGAKSIRYEARVWLEGETYVSHAWPIDVASCGGSEDDALRMLEEAVALFVESTREMGTLDVILEEAGYSVKDGVLTPPTAKYSVATVDISQ